MSINDMLAFGALFTCSTAACATATPPSKDPPAVSQVHGAYSVTEVRIGASGRAESTVHSITQAQSMERAAQIGDGPRPQDVIGRVPCSSSSVHLYDASLATCRIAGCNEICFELTDPNPPVNGTVYLGQYCVTSACNYSWNSMVRSYWTGDRTAELWRNYPGASQCTEVLGDRWSYKDAGWCGQNSDYLIILK